MTQKLPSQILKKMEETAGILFHDLTPLPKADVKAALEAKRAVYVFTPTGEHAYTFFPSEEEGKVLETHRKLILPVPEIVAKIAAVDCIIMVW